MKKQTKILIGSLLVVIILIVAVSLNFPPLFKGKSSGTIGKADKYRKTAMTEKDIKLRSELTADTAKLRGMIQGLAFFTVFTNDLGVKIDSCVFEYQSKGLTASEAGYKNMMALNDYAVFIRNNNQTLTNTISLLTGFYTGKEADQSVDVEKNLREFHNYVKMLSEKDSVLEAALKSMDKFMMTVKTLKDRKVELARLKSVRDQLLIKGLQFGALVDDKPFTAAVMAYAITGQQELQRILAQEKLNEIVIDGVGGNGGIGGNGGRGGNGGNGGAGGAGGAQEQLKTLSQEKLNFMSQEKIAALAQDKLSIFNQDVLRVVVGSKPIGFVDIMTATNDKLAFVGAGPVYQIVYDKVNLQVIIVGRADLNKLSPAAKQELGIVEIGAFSKDGINIVFSNIDLKGQFMALPIGAVFSSEQINIILSKENISAIAALCANSLNVIGIYI